MQDNWVRLVVSWWTKPPLPEALNVYPITGSVEFEDGKAVFQLAKFGNTVKIDTDQLFRISAVEHGKKDLK